MSKNTENWDGDIRLVEFLEHFNLSRTSYYRGRARGTLPPISKVGGRSFIFKEDLAAWRERMRDEGESAATASKMGGA